MRPDYTVNCEWEDPGDLHYFLRSWDLLNKVPQFVQIPAGT